jgi:hypothetical protein
MPENQERHAEGNAGKPSAARDADLTMAEKCENSAPCDERLADIMPAARGCQDGGDVPRQQISHDS